MNKASRKTTTPELRKKTIMRFLSDQDSVSIQEIVEECNASEITIRRDLAKLESKGLLIRTHGGALKRVAADHLFAYNHKLMQNRKSKEYICQIASRFIKANDIIFIDSGSTMSFLPKYISNTDSLTVITNSLPIASELINFDNIRLILIGGEVVHKRKAIYGHAAVQNVMQYHANKAFIGTDGISLSNGISSYDDKEASITIKMAENADEIFVLCDSSKMERNSYFKFAPLSIVDYVITDKGVAPGLISKYENNHIHLIKE